MLIFTQNVMQVTQNILALIPQRDPFVMVDKLVFCNEKIARSSFQIKAQNIFVENGNFKEPGIVENIAQTAAARAGYLASGYSGAPSIGYIGDVKNLEIMYLPKINDNLETEISMEDQIFDVTLINGKVWCGESLVASCSMKIFITQPK